MTSFAIASLQLETARGDNLAVLRTEIESVVARFPWVRMAVLGELSAARQVLPGYEFCFSARPNLQKNGFAST